MYFVPHKLNLLVELKQLEEIFDKVVKNDLKDYQKYLEIIENNEKTLGQIKKN